jgi:acyl dehydratase
MTLREVAGRRYGPFPADTCEASIARFVAAVGDDAERWVGSVPPAYAAAALFAAAPAFLTDPRVAAATRSLLHTDQVFTWQRAVRVGEPIEIAGTVTAVRERGAVHLVTFAISASGPDGPWLEASSTFLMSPDPAGEAAEEAEPLLEQRGPMDVPTPAPLPEQGSELPPLQVSASRADLVRYAAASGDLNPIHWDHGSARAAGLPGVAVHGLLMAAWLAAAAGRHAPGVDPLRSMRIRFRRPLRPAVAARITGRVTRRDESGADLSLALIAGGDTAVTAIARVTA